MEEVNTEKLTRRTGRKWAFIAILLSLPVAILVDHFDPGGGTPAFIFLGLTILLVRVFWNLRPHAWFWMAIAAVTFIHVALLVIVPWNNWANHSYPAPELWPIGMADFAFIVGFIKLVERAMRRDDGASSRA